MLITMLCVANVVAVAALVLVVLYRIELGRLEDECMNLRHELWKAHRGPEGFGEPGAVKLQRGRPRMTGSWAFLSRFDITDPKTGELYLRRWRIVQTPWFAIYLHKIATPDKDRDLHDHPWPFVSLVLRGGYDELLVTTNTAMDDYLRGGRPPFRVRRWMSLGCRRATDAHRITRLHRTPTWTLVLTGPRRRSWGFYTEHGFVDWRKYLGLDQ